MKHFTLLIAPCIALCAVLGSCSSRPPARDPLGERLPEATVRTLDGAQLTFPDDLAGAPAVLLLGFVQEAQFDADRWLLGLLQLELDAQVYEVPTIPGALVGLLSGRIDAGMRRGIPDGDWGAVATAYGAGAGRLEAFTGSAGPRNVRVLLLDAEGVVRWSHHEGYSARVALELARALEELR